MRRSHTRPALAALLLALAHPALPPVTRADPRASPHYLVIADALDLAGGTASAASYALQVSLDDGGGPAADASGQLAVIAGYISPLNVVTQPQLVLKVVLTGNTLVLSWPGALAGFTLETADTLAATVSWTPVAPSPGLSNGYFTVTNTVAGHSRFYRLRSP